MPRSSRLAAIAAAITILASGPSIAMDDYLRASSNAPTAIRLCGDTGDSTIKTADCKKAGTDKLVAQIDKAFDAALAKMPATIKPLLKRDQAWFNEMIIDAAEVLADADADELKESFAEALRRRARRNGNRPAWPRRQLGQRLRQHHADAGRGRRLSPRRRSPWRLWRRPATKLQADRAGQACRERLAVRPRTHRPGQDRRTRKATVVEGPPPGRELAHRCDPGRRRGRPRRMRIHGADHGQLFCRRQGRSVRQGRYHFRHPDLRLHQAGDRDR